MCSRDFVGLYSTFQALYFSSLNNNVFFFFFLFEVAVGGGPLASSFLSKLGLFPVTFSVFCFHYSFDPTRNLPS